MTHYDPRYADDTDQPFSIPGYSNFPRAIARKAKKLFRARDDIRVEEGEDSDLAQEIDEVLAMRTAQPYAYWQETLEPKVDDWYDRR